MARKSRKMTWKDGWFEDSVMERKRNKGFSWLSFFAGAYVVAITFIFKMPTLYLAAGWIVALQEFSIVPESDSIFKNSYIDETSRKFDPWRVGFPSHGFAIKIIFFTALGIFHAATVIIGDYKDSKRLLKSWELYSFSRSLYVILKSIVNTDTIISATKFDKYPLTDLILMSIIENILARKLESAVSLEEDFQVNRRSMETKPGVVKRIFKTLLTGILRGIEHVGEGLCFFVAINEWMGSGLLLFAGPAVCPKAPLLLEGK